MADDAVTRFGERAAELGIEVRAREFPAGTRTAGDAAAAVGCELAQIVKSLVFVADGAPVLVLTSGTNRVDEPRVAAELEAEVLRKADATEARTATGYAIGGTPPFGHVAPLPVLCDRDLTRFTEVWAAAGSPTSVFPIPPAELLRATSARVVDVSG